MLLLDDPKILQESSGSPAGGQGAGQSRRGSMATVSSTAKELEQNIGKGVPAEANPAVAGSDGRKNAVAPEQGADPDNRNSGRFKEQCGFGHQRNGIKSGEIIPRGKRDDRKTVLNK
ncbi:unnamed protein product [Ectocarpus sp. CCAP 1310/34]|nr:unnamed protein product [Ectocarpus sp. CCAP 1310/34]